MTVNQRTDLLNILEQVHSTTAAIIQQNTILTHSQQLQDDD